MQVHIAQEHSGGIRLWKNSCCFTNEEVQRKTLSPYAKCLSEFLSPYSVLCNILELWNSFLGTEIFIFFKKLFFFMYGFFQEGGMTKQDDYKVSKSRVKSSFFKIVWYVCSVPGSTLDLEELS